METPASLVSIRSAIEEELSALLRDRSAPLYEMMRYHLGWEGNALLAPGKYVRPVLCLLTCTTVGGDWRQAIPGAVALELLHNFSLVHDDIQDRSLTRRGRSTVWALWGTSQAINAGDGMYALSRLAVLRLRERVVAEERVLRCAWILDEACLALCEGQYMDIAFQARETVTFEEYEDMVGRKTGALFGCSLETGAVIGAGIGETGVRLRAAGFQLGLAYQMRDDLLDLWGDGATGKEIGADVREKKKSLPVVYGLSRDGPEGDRLREIYRKPALSPKEVEESIALLGRLGAREFCIHSAERHYREGLRLLRDAVPESRARRELEETAAYLVQRDR
ncbi:MAG: polyprenyl synthetase family protein [Chloroflexi bacterium]|nr:polyprenyl synthetase family protein [Chloroflexota bacterium]